MPSTGLEPFKGDGNPAENPENFVCAYMRWSANENDDFRKMQFKYFLHAGGAADMWWEELGPTEKATWSSILAAFHLRWPKITGMKKTADDYVDELLNTSSLKDEELGKKVEVSGIKVWSHIAWANKVEKLAAGAKIQMTNILNMYIGMVRKSLLDILKLKVDSKHANWADFCKAVREVDMEHIKDGVERMQRDQEISRDLARRLQLLESPATRQCLPTASSNPPGPPSAAPRAPVVRNASTYPVQRQPAPAQPMHAAMTDAEKAAFQARIDELPHHPDTLTGHLAYEAQKQAWFQKYGERTCVEQGTPFPLYPRTAGVCTGECFNCVTHGHLASDCPLEPICYLNPKERAWCRICSLILGAFRRNEAVRINLVLHEALGFGDCRDKYDGCSYRVGMEPS
ncbi:hypothetical protein JAAARDRAFT_63050 [Jaapia argillacea MUCL 33604]|uniref:CCHC-type domain-containing protein n=1 Tax=Jaapia argillacea MUCL 33604 TaxID=933084 RepID=A0A067P782_9AGAM|nr:hypothetical protein JAAARDRAFT_63050 [Jaapia argillacea MUCL 33604]